MTEQQISLDDWRRWLRHQGITPEMLYDAPDPGTDWVEITTHDDWAENRRVYQRKSRST